MRISTADRYFFICHCEPWMRSACCREVAFKEVDGETFCVLHYPGEKKGEIFREALNRKLKAEDFDFGGVWFPRDVDFSGLTLREASFRKARFRFHARFNKTKFISYADFREAEFVEVDFSSAQFMEVDFKEASFERAFFFNARFGAEAHFNPARFATRADFGSAEFVGPAHFGKAKLIGAYFANAKFGSAANFGAVKFASPNFVKAQFNDWTYFGGATFSGSPVFENAGFDEVDFSEAEFDAGADFEEAKFHGEADFSAALMNGNTSFDNADFEKQAYFSKTRFGNLGAEMQNKTIGFINATFKDKVVFESSNFASEVTLRLDGATFEQPNLVTFDDVVLRPMWFIGIDSRALHFVKVQWRRLQSPKLVSIEVEELQQKQIARPYESLEIACRQLAVNAEENNRYAQAARFRLIANGARRRQSWHNLIAKPKEWDSWSDLDPLLWIYGLLSGYGERAWQAASVLAGICLLFAVLFFVGQRDGHWWYYSHSNAIAGVKQSGEQTPMLRDFREAVIYSAGVITLQKPEPLPANRRAKALVLFETVLGPLQAALLALAIRRKFMR